MPIPAQAFALCLWWVIGSASAQETDLPMEQLFQAIDTKRAGKISVADFHDFAKEMSLARVRKHHPMSDIDADHDGKVSLQEILVTFPESVDMEDFSAHEKAKFKAADKNGDGYLNKDEFTAFEVPEIDEAVEEAYARSIFDSKDKDKNGALTLREFNQLSEEEPHGDTQLLHDFEKLDKNGDGTLNLAEVIAWESGRHFAEEFLRFVAEHADTDKDGQVTLAEFVAAKPGIEGHDSSHYMQEWVRLLQLKGGELSESAMEGLFQAIDTKNTGFISVAGLHAFTRDMQVRGVSHARPDHLDTDRDGKVSLQEILATFTDPDSTDMEAFSAHETAKFKAADKNHDGYLDKHEFTAFELPELDEAVEAAYARSIFDSKDKDKNGALTLREFNQLSEEEPVGETQLLHEFEKLDKNGDGTLALAEVIAWESGRHFVEEFFRFVAEHADTDKDGRVTLMEFIAAKPGIEGHESSHYLEECVRQLEL